MKPFLTFLFFVISGFCFAQKPEVRNVVTHNRTTVVTNPATGSKSYSRWGLFPTPDYPVRKIIMNVTLGSPDSLNTAHWDYLDHIFLRRQGGVNGKSHNYEIGRMLTPYGSIYNKGWNWKWEVDVTDFAPFMRDSVEIEYIHSGYEPATVGWALTIDFEIVPGPPVVIPMGITPLWNKGYKYGDPNERIEDNLLPVSYKSITGAAISRIRIQHTGHGMDRPKGCSEFCSRWREIMLDGRVIDRRDMWKDCGANPLYPQGGTWIYDRAYWCPGDLQKPDVIDAMVTPGDHKISLQMEPYRATENIQAVEDISAYLFHYSGPVKKTDVAIDEIMVPNNEQQFSRLNPACFNPAIIIRNLGSERLKTVTVTYGTEGFPGKTFQWSGDLDFNKTAVIEIPGELQMKKGLNTFKATLSKPNGRKDGWSGDNELATSFSSPQMMPSDFILEFFTNNVPHDNEVLLTGSNAEVLFHITPENLSANTRYLDTISLPEGMYELRLQDSSGDGLEFWAEPQNGDGYLRLFDLKRNLIHAFESDCGNGEMLSFIASSKFVADTTEARYGFSLYPRLVTKETELSVVSNKTGNMIVQITVDGKIWEKHEYQNIKNASYKYDLSNLPSGRIVLEVFMDGVSRFKGRLNKRRH